MPRTPKASPEFERTQAFIKRYSVLPSQEDYDVVTIWAMGTWTFSPAAPFRPVTYPYLYLTGSKGSGKTVLGRDVFSYICRNYKSMVGVTGPALFRTIGQYDEESGEVIPHYPTMGLDEIDATYSGSKDENLRLVLNDGYKPGSTIPRSAGKVTIEYPSFCPKVLIGIDNGHLPDTVTDRSIRIDIRKGTSEQLASIEPLYSFDVEDEATEIQQALADWAKREAMILRDYRPTAPKALSGRPWEIARPLVQLAKALGIEQRITDALVSVMSRKPSAGKEALYRSVLNLFTELNVDRLTSRQIMDRLSADGINVPGNSQKGLSAVVGSDGVTAKYIRLPEGHPGIVTENDGTKRYVARGYMRFSFDDAFVEYLSEDDD